MARFRGLPDTPIDWLALKVREYLHMPDPLMLYTVIGSLAANMIEGNPVWLMLVGAPGSGKTELLMALLGVPGVHPVSSLEGKGVFLSGTSARERATDATGGLLRQVGEAGALVIDDLSCILSLPADQIRIVMDVMRQTFSGRYDRAMGVDGGKILHWCGKLAFLGGATGSIDHYHSVSASLGERWIYYRLTEEDGYHKSRRALVNAGFSSWREELRELMRSFFDVEELGFKSIAARPEMMTAEMVRIIRIASFVAPCRSAVLRETSGSREIIGPRETEQSSRLAGTLGQLMAGLKVVGVSEANRWKSIKRVALDSMPRMRQMLVEYLLINPTISAEEAMNLVGCSQSVMLRTLQDLAVHHVVEREKSLTGIVRYGLTARMKTEYERGFLQ